MASGVYFSKLFRVRVRVLGREGVRRVFGVLCYFEDWDEFVCCAFAKNYRGLMLLLLLLMMMMQRNVEKSLRQ